MVRGEEDNFSPGNNMAQVPYIQQWVNQVLLQDYKWETNCQWMMNWGLTSPSPSWAFSSTGHIDGKDNKTRASEIGSDRTSHGGGDSQVFLFVFLTIIEYNYATERPREGGRWARKETRRGKLKAGLGWGRWKIQKMKNCWRKKTVLLVNFFSSDPN